MKNCLKTQLKATVENNSLMFFNSVKMKKGNNAISGATINNTLKIEKIANSDLVIAIPKDKSFTTSNSCTLIDTDTYYKYFSLGDTSSTLVFPNDDNDAYYFYILKSENITWLTTQYPATQLRFIDISWLESNTVLTRTGGDNSYSDSELIGNIADIAQSPFLTNVFLGNGTALKGRMEDFAEAGWNSGRRDGSITISNANAPQTFHGVAISARTTYVLTFSANNVVVTVSENTVATYNGSSWTYE